MLYIDYRIAAAYTRGQEDSRSNILSQEALLPWEQAVSRYVPFLPPQWLPIGGNTAADSFSRLNLELCLFWGLFVQQGPYFVGPFSTNNTKGVFFFSGSRLCQDMSLYTAADFPSRHNLAQWISLLDRRMFKPILDPFKLQPCYACTGGYCRSHGPYYVGPSSATTSLKGFLT